MRRLLLTTILIWPGLAMSACADSPAVPPTVSVDPIQSGQVEPVSTQIEPVKSTAWPDVMQDLVTAPDATGLVRFDYKKLTESPAAMASLDQYIAYHEGLSPSQMDPQAATAYWGNLYNALTIKVVADAYPVKSIRKVGSSFSMGPWKKDVSVVEGKDISLDDIEHGIMRKQFPSPLIHYMVNCASVGCPNLKIGEWQTATFDADRDAAARDFINSPRGAKITDKGLVVSSIYKWFDEDFGGSKQGVLNHLREYADADLAAAIDGGAKISGYDYDWTLNGVGHE